MLNRKEAIESIFKQHPENSLYVITTGFLCRAVYELYPDKKNIFYMQGSMGLAPAIALGLALNTEKNVIAINGDAAHLMQLGITHTIRDCDLDNLFVYILDNGCHESVGGFECSKLEESYVGVNEIYKISKDGKLPRVGYDFIENKNNFINSI